MSSLKHVERTMDLWAIKPMNNESLLKRYSNFVARA
jgi:hypothetical protein